MAKNLVIVESPAKAKTIGKILGKDFSVKSSMGHIRDLPVKRFGVDVKKDFKPEYIIVPTRKKVLSELVAAVKKADSIYLAPDPDREGEAIAWHLRQALDKAGKGKEFFRVSYNEVTPRGVRAAFDQPHEIEMNRVDAQQARRVVDRIVGYRVSPLLWSRVKRGASAGRVQSVALRLVCEREKLIKDFVPEPYWILGANVRKLAGEVDPFHIALHEIDGENADVRKEEIATKAVEELDGRKMRVKKIGTKDVQRRAPAPFITSTLQQAASTKYRLSPAGTMRIAQRLYEGVDIDGEAVGLITYMRTDSVNISADAIAACREYVGDKFGADFVPEKPNVFKSRKSAQEAHEAIRPTDVSRSPETLSKKLSAPELRLYKLIWERFVASQMKPAIIRQRSVDVEAEKQEGAEGSAYTFRASCSEIVFPGYMKVAGTKLPSKNASDDEGEGEKEQKLPVVAEGEPLECLELLCDRKETQPPRRFSEASLVRELEENGVGRPSTYALILYTLNERKYVTKEKRALTPTELGEKVNEFLVTNLGELFAVDFTAGMEEGLDQVEDGKSEWTTMVQEFYDRFSQWLEKAKGPAADPEVVNSLLTELEKVTEWTPAVKYGKRIYSDEKFVVSLRKQLDEAKRKVSERQLEALVKLSVRYVEALPTLKEAIDKAGLTEVLTKAAADEKEVAPLTIRKMELLTGVTVEEPDPEKKKGFNDKAFIDSIQSIVAAKRALSDNQIRQLNRLIVKYSEQIPNFEAIKDELSLEEAAAGKDEEIVQMMELMAKVEKWRAATMRGKREFDDKKFYESLRGQFDQRGTLSPRQKAALKRMAARYRKELETEEEESDGAEAAEGGDEAAKTES